MNIRPFTETDIPHLVKILTINGQYGYPEIEGPEAMQRVAKCDAAIFLIAEADGKVMGLIRGIYDGSRAMIHLLSVHPDVHGRGIGGALVEAMYAELRQRGAPTVSVTVTDESAAYWTKIGFELLPVNLMLREIPIP